MMFAARSRTPASLVVPVLETFSSGYLYGAGNVETAPLAMPNDIEAGDLLVCLIVTGAGVTMTVGGQSGFNFVTYAAISGEATVLCFAKVAVTGDTLTFTPSIGTYMNYQILRIKNANTINGAVLHNISGVALNPPSHTATHAGKKYISLVSCATGSTAAAATTVPSGYTYISHRSELNSIISSYKQNTAYIEDPPGFVWLNSTNSSVLTLLAYKVQ